MPKNKEYKSPFCIRGAHLNCPLPLALESYWACEADCYHCLGRKLNQIWGTEQRVTNPEHVARKLQNSQKTNDPKSPMAMALKKKKTIWIGRKSDPYQPIENELGVTRKIIQSLMDLDWSFVVCSKYLTNAKRDEDLFDKGRSLMTFLIEITPGAESDWTIFERERTTPIPTRLKLAQRWMKRGIPIGIRGEPFIPGYHTPKEFRDMLKRLRSYGLKSYNTYNLHLNDYTAKRLYNIGLDIERIWEHNQDRLWKPIQQELCKIAEEEGIVLGCPDFVNVPPNWRARTNTCCGVSVPNSFQFNTHCWRRRLQHGADRKKLLDNTWEGIGTEEDQKKAHTILFDKSKDQYTMRDAGL